MSHLALVFGFIGRLYAIRRALDYDLSDLNIPLQMFESAADDYPHVMEAWNRIWKSHMDTWKACR